MHIQYLGAKSSAKMIHLREQKILKQLPFQGSYRDILEDFVRQPAAGSCLLMRLNGAENWTIFLTLHHVHLLWNEEIQII